MGNTVPKWGAAVNGAPGALQSRDPGLPAGRRSPASIWINSPQALADQGLGERSDVFCEDMVSQKIRRLDAASSEERGGKGGYHRIAFKSLSLVICSSE